MLTLKDSYIFSFHKDLTPIAECEDGDMVCFETMDCYCGQIRTENDLSSSFHGHANPATGPLYVKGAEPGDALVVEILKVSVAEQGVCTTSGSCVRNWGNTEFRTKVIPIKDDYAYFNDVRWPICPMIGVMGTAPSEGDVSTGDSFRNGGNMDSPIITEGVTVYFPVQVPGALLAMGDIHATMGEGEVSGTGIEISGKITVRVHVVKHAELNWPVTETEDAWFVNTNGRTADEAIRRGYFELQRLIVKAYGWDETDANMYISLQGLTAANQACLGEHTIDLEGPTFRVGCRKAAGKPPLVG